MKHMSNLSIRAAITTEMKISGNDFKVTEAGLNSGSRGQPGPALCS